MSELNNYLPDDGQPIALTGPVVRPPKGDLPLRGDLAHIGLARRFLVAHYAVPVAMTIGSAPAALVRSSQTPDDVICTLPAGSTFEALDVTSSWVWGCVSVDGPAGYVARSAFA